MKEGIHQVILYNLLMGGVQNKQIYKSESKLVVAYDCGGEWECGRVTDYTNTRFLWGMMKTKDCPKLKIVGDC